MSHRLLIQVVAHQAVLAQPKAFAVADLIVTEEAFMRRTTLQDAKARQSELVRLAAEQEPHESLADFMRRSPLYGAEDIELLRDESLTREVELCAD
jgi:antitoxin Phd